MSKELFTLTIDDIDITFDDNTFNVEEQLKVFCIKHNLEFKVEHLYNIRRAEMYLCIDTNKKCILKIIDTTKPESRLHNTSYGNIRAWIDTEFISNSNIHISVNEHLVETEYLEIISITLDSRKDYILYKDKNTRVTLLSRGELLVYYDDSPWG